MKLDFKDWTDFHHQIYRIYHGIIAISLLPFFLVFLEVELADIKESRVSQLVEWAILMVFIPVGGYLIWMIWNSNRFRIDNSIDRSLVEKLKEFRKVEVRKYLWMELVCVIALLGLWLTAHYLFVIVYFAGLAQFSFLRPSEERVSRLLALTKEDRKKLREEKFIKKDA